MSPKKIAILQSSYIPWKGYFNIIKCVDAFILLDDVQYTRRDWRNRNLIKTKHGLKWLTIPVNVKGQYFIHIKDVKTAGSSWRADHWRQISEAYGNAPYFSSLADRFENLYLNDQEEDLSKINLNFIRLINTILDIKTPIHWSMEFNVSQEKTERLMGLCKSLNAGEYISGPAAKSYLNEDLFRENGIEVKWADYSNYAEYQQPYPPFEHGVSIVDLLFNEGPNAVNFLKERIWN